MTRAHEELLSAALSMPEVARAEMAERLLDSLETDRASIDAAWGAEAERRIEQIDSSEVELLPGEKVMADLRARCK